MNKTFRRSTGFLLLIFILSSCRGITPMGTYEQSKIRFKLDKIRVDGLYGSPDGLRSLSYEFCLPANIQIYQTVIYTDPTVQIYPGSRGRIGCDSSQALALGHTHQSNWRQVLMGVAGLPYVIEIRQTDFE